MKNSQFYILLGFLLLHLYWTSPDKPLPALILAGLFMAAGPFIQVAELAAADKKKDSK